MLSIQTMCSVNDCKRKSRGKNGLCTPHYMRLWRYGSAEGTPAPRTKKTCLVKDCDRPYKGRGYCRFHMRRVKSTGDPLVTLKPKAYNGQLCKVDSCNKVACLKDYCRGHHKKWLKYGNPTIVKNKLHGLSGLPEYKIWTAIKQRTSNPADSGFKNYGARSISMCERWHSSFENFLADMGYRPSKNYSVERKDNNGNYEPNNCYWATPEQQHNNKRTNVLLTLNGQTMTISQWSKHTGIYYETLRGRLRAGWPIQMVLTQPVQKRKLN